MELIKNYNEKELTIETGNKIDTTTAPDFENEIMDEMGNFDSLTLDLKNLEYISSAGLRVLILVQKKLKADDIPFVIINTNDNIKNILTMSGFDKILNIQ
ncbi:anti-sigma factor antagonist [Methanobrevibacter ruminantium M1]|uniref:Anti-sigma factor antagonist n=1 Tax=Methanobrevibacter ruminantium (strain ATCC 35063 / DSM 1093 / JCM 13430 / OCM 146 / M1) TaxID=634498 RepID=D3E181_METRM|nr:STAS domain-containing protein [Methanobrevibacter ruminantium]ADC46364.1 anti-sigma factor antagonist [Methanobrevibacter ruminantium M1]